MFTAHRFSLAGLLSLVLAHSAFAAECGPDQSRGAQVFANECSVCHAVAKGGATMMGLQLLPGDA
jgi:cytochrome c